MPKEIIQLIDTTGSQNYPIAPHVRTQRKTVLLDADRIFVTKLSERDSKMAEEEGEGGVLTFTFATPYRGHPGYVALDDLNPGNFDEKVAQIDFDGATFIMPAWRAMLAAWQEEFGHADPPPDTVVIIPTDGGLDTDTSHGPSDEQQFQDALRHLPPHFSVVIVIVGKGADNAEALSSYQRIAANSNGRLTVESLQGETDANAIADRMLQLVS